MDGIFEVRIPLAASDMLRAYRNIASRGDKINFSRCSDPHIVSNLLLMFLEELPDPILTSNLYENFIALPFIGLSFLLFYFLKHL